jgi:hypothetical protein
MGDEDPMLPSGSVFAGRYRIIRHLGEGDRKRTYLADDTLLPRRVAVALIRSAAAKSDPEGTRREAEALARAGTHENVVTFHDGGVVEGTEFLVFDYLQGGTLREYLAKRAARGRPLSVEEVMRFGRDMARALAHVHRLGFIHRDVAPGNIWLDDSQVAHLGDFDSVVWLDAALSPKALPPTTEAYAAPEHIAGGPLDQRSDLYSLGAVLFEALTGHRPPRSPRRAIAARMRELRPDSPRTLRETICRLLAELPADRPASADEVLEALNPGRVYHTVEEGLIPWADTLPFPLASILWHYDGEPEPANKIDYLLKFFEAVAQFLATVLLSACISDRELYETSRSAWFGWGERSRLLTLRIATFGVWVELFVRLAKTLRGLLQDEVGVERCRGLFKVADADLVETLVSEETEGILRHALDCRNTWSGHGGVAGIQVQRGRLRELEDLLSRVRAQLGWSFEAWTLFQPGPMIYSRGVFELTATILTGPNPAFRRKQMQLLEALDAGRLYLLSEGNQRALELVPFVRLLAGKTGQDACYFYNRFEGSEARWVSYHFHAEPELVLPDDELTDLLSRLSPPISAD